MKREFIRLRLYEERSMRKMLQLLLSVILIWILTAGSFAIMAQEEQSPPKTITGKVISSEDNLPIPGVNIVIKGTQTGTITDANGNFSIQASNGDILQISFIGYLKEEIPVGSSNNIDVSLVLDVARLDEVVVVGYGTKRKADMTSAQVSVSSEEIEKSYATSIDQVLQGRAAGVYVTQNSGQPGGGVSVNIRGINSISSSTEPMYVIDGVQIMGNMTDNTSNALAGINPDDIESMEVLLGPSAIAIYGSRASNGVIVITTKKGKAGQTKISYSGTFSLQEVPDLLPTMNLREFAEYDNTLKEINNQTPRPEFADPSVLGEGTNWQKELFRDAPMQKHQISLSGGTERTSYYLSTEYFNQDGVALGSGFKRSSVRLNLDNKTRDWLTIGTKMSVSQTKEKITYAEADLIGIAIEQSPEIPVRNPDGTWGGPPTTQYHLSNPVALAQIQDFTRKRLFGLGTMYVEITFLEGLKLRTELNGDMEYTNEYKYDPSYVIGGYVKESNSSTRLARNRYGWNFNVLLNYIRSFGNHNLSAMVSHEAQESVWEELSGTRDGFISNTIQELDQGSTDNASNSSSKGDWALESYFGRLGYNYNSKYIVEATIRADGSPSFGQNNRWGYFPSFSAAWRISEESFLQNVSQIRNLKLRFEYGITGNQNSHGPTYYATMRPWPTPWGTGFLPSNYSNPDFQWEKTEQYNIGLDISLFNNRLEFAADAYLKNISNLMMQIPLPDYMGTSEEGSVTAPWQNIGEMENRGLGFILNTVAIERPFVWRSGINISIDRNKLTKLYTDNSLLDRTVWFMDGFISRSVVGEPLWQFYGYQSEGLFQSIEEIENHATQNTRGLIDESLGTWVGDVKFKNNFEDSVINEQDRTFIGSPWPKFTFGFNNSFSYKNFELGIFINGVVGNKIYNYQRYRNENPNGSGPGRGYLKTAANFARIGTDAEGNPYIINEGTTIPRISANDANGNNKPSDIFVEDGSYLRVKNIQLTYTLPSKLLTKLPVSSIRITGNVQNAFTITNYSGYDPEIGSTIDNDNEYNIITGIDYRRYPSSRIYSFTLTVDF